MTLPANTHDKINRRKYMDQTSLNNLLQPKSVAIVGASAQPGKIGYTVIENLLKGGYQANSSHHPTA
jgi:acyl-CoA synthetase (NDP forming)